MMPDPEDGNPALLTGMNSARVPVDFQPTMFPGELVKEGCFPGTAL